MFKITNIIQDSFDATALIDEYINTNLEPDDKIITFDFTSFYAEIIIRLNK